MNTIEEELTELLRRKAGAIDATPDDEDLAVRRHARHFDATIVPLAPHESPVIDSRRSRVLLSAAAAIVLLVPVLLFVAIRSNSQPENDIIQIGNDAPLAQRWLDREIYPRLDGTTQLGEVYGTLAIPGAETPRMTSVVLGRRDGDRWTDVNTISVSQPGVGPLLDDAVIEQTQLGGKQVSKYSLAGRTWFRWQLDDAVVTINASTDADALLADLVVEPSSDGGWPVLRLGPLPAGLQVIDGPAQNQFEPFPGIATDSGAGPGFDLYVYPTLELPVLPTDYDAVTVRGAAGLLADVDGDHLVAWQVDGDAWAVLSVRGGEGDDAVGLANAIDFIGRDQWELIYDESVDNFASAPTTTAAAPPKPTTTSVAVPPQNTRPTVTTTCAALEGNTPLGVDDLSLDEVGVLTYRYTLDGINLGEAIQVFDDESCTPESDAWLLIIRPVLDPDMLRRNGTLCDVYSLLVGADATPANASTVLTQLGGEPLLRDECT